MFTVSEWWELLDSQEVFYSTELCTNFKIMKQFHAALSLHTEAGKMAEDRIIHLCLYSLFV
jgi:hypothetical protein